MKKTVILNNVEKNGISNKSNWKPGILKIWNFDKLPKIYEVKKKSLIDFFTKKHM